CVCAFVVWCVSVSSWRVRVHLLLFIALCTRRHLPFSFLCRRECWAVYMSVCVCVCVCVCVWLVVGVWLLVVCVVVCVCGCVGGGVLGSLSVVKVSRLKPAGWGPP